MDDKEFTEIVQSTKGVVLSAIQAHLPSRHRHAIDDIAQETYLRAYRGLMKSAFRGESALSTWLYAIAKNETLRMIKRLDRHERRFSRDAPLPPGADAREGDGSEEGLAGLREIIPTLPEKYRSVFELAVQGFTDREISDRLSISHGTVKSRKSRGREILLKLMRKGGYPGYE